MKKIVSLLVIFSILVSATAGFAYDFNGVKRLVSELEIMVGDPNGDFRADAPVTRAEFAKIAVMSSVYKNTVATNVKVSPYPDVNYKHWAAPYILAAVSGQIITGYEDSTFKPNGNVKLEEAVTVALRLLGYTNNDFGSSWPYGQMGLGNKLGLTDNIDKSIGESLTRAEVATLIYNTLNTVSKDTNTKYITKLGYQLVEDAVLIASSNEDTSVGADKVYTSEGTFRVNSNFNFEDIGKKGDLIVKNSTEIAGFIPSSQTIKTYSIYQILDENIIVSDNGVLTALDSEKSLTVYNKSTKTTLSALTNTVASGDVLTVYSNDKGVIDYGMVKTDSLKGPYVVNTSSWSVSGELEAYSIIRNGEKATAQSVVLNDVYYISSALKTVYVYSNKVTGVYENALPNKDSLTSVVVSGVTYGIESAQALSALSSSGSFNYGDTVTLLLGRNGKVAGIAQKSSTQNVAGVLTDSSKKTYTDASGNQYTSYYATVVTASGNSMEYKTTKDCTSLKNSVVNVSIKNSNATISKLTSQSGVSGVVNYEKRTIGSNSLAQNIEILEVSSTKPSDPSLYGKVFVQRLNGVSIATGNVLYYSKNADGEINQLILKDVTGDLYSYGVVISASSSSNGMNSSGVYNCDIGGTTRTVSGSSIYSVGSNSPAQFKVSNGNVFGINKLTEIEGTVTEVSDSYITVSGENVYLLSDKAVAYVKSGVSKYMAISVSSINTSDYNVCAYADGTERSGGRVRVLICTEK